MTVELSRRERRYLRERRKRYYTTLRFVGITLATLLAALIVLAVLLICGVIPLSDT